MNKDRDPRIAIIGAGPAGLLTAHYLTERGYRNVVVLEKLGRIGGLCKTITVAGHAFDLGANYTTSAYKEILRIARKLKFELYSERPFSAMLVPENGPVHTITIFKASRQWPDSKTIPLLQFSRALLRFVWIRWRLSDVIDKPTFADTEKADDGYLARTVYDWLEHHDLLELQRVFELPVTLMGYGYLDETAALYALKFMTLKTFIPMVLKETPFIGRFIAWPKRFLFGYQRFFDRLSWQFDVRFNITIKSIERSGGKTSLTYTKLDQNMNDVDESEEEKLQVDHLILACPLNPKYNDSLKGVLEPDELGLFEKIVSNSYCMTTRHVELPAKLIKDHTPLFAVFPVPPHGSYEPYGVAKQWADSSFVQFYSRTPDDPDIPLSVLEEKTNKAIGKLVCQMDGRILPADQFIDTFNRWDYFQHLSPDEISDGWYNKLENLQGKYGTYYVGGATNFELVEPIAEYAKNLVNENFPVRSDKSGPIDWWRVLKWSLLIGLVLLIGYCAVATPPQQIYAEIPLGTGEGRAVSERFWRAFQSRDVSELKPAACENNPKAEGESLICELEWAVNQQPGDPLLPLLANSTYLWRVQTLLYKDNRSSDLALATKFAKQSRQNGNPFAIGFEASAVWLSGDFDEGYKLMEQATQEWPSFHGFIEGEQLSVGLNPAHEGTIPYEKATWAFNRMMNTCMFGDHSPEWLQVPASVPMGRFMFNVAAIVFRLIGTQYCYNIPAAPFGMPGAFITRGDIFLKAGMYDKALVSYQNAKASPGYDIWPLKQRIDKRIGNLDVYRAAFLRDTGVQGSKDECLGMFGQSRYYCAGCHAAEFKDPCDNLGATASR